MSGLGNKLITSKQLIAETGLLVSTFALMESAFPADERRKSTKWVEQLGYANFHLWALPHPDRTIIAFLSWWEWDDLRFVEHFAVNERFRGLGNGSQLFGMFLEHAQKTVLLEVEPPVNNLSIRRIEFYKRHGMNLLDIAYQQPPYRVEYKPKDMLLMCSSAAQMLTIKTWVKRIHNEVYCPQLLE